MKNMEEMVEITEEQRSEKEPMLREMCGVIEKSGILTDTDGSKPTADEIFNGSTVVMIHLYYAVALDELGIAKLDIKKLNNMNND